jgi:toxin YoeB
MRKVAFLPDAFEDFNYWKRENSKIHAKILDLIRDIQRNPVDGLGKPEPLKRDLQGMWSRRITEEHRLVYKLTDEEIIIVSCRYHYRD